MDKSIRVSLLGNVHNENPTENNVWEAFGGLEGSNGSWNEPNSSMPTKFAKKVIFKAGVFAARLQLKHTASKQASNSRSTVNRQGERNTMRHKT